MSNELNVENQDKVLVVSFTRPEIRNPLSLTVLDQLNDIVTEVGETGRFEGIVFTGSQLSFASGADLREIAHVTADDAPEFARKGQNLMVRIAASSLVTVAAINGFCFGGALDLALSCDYRIASSTAKFAHPGAGLGIITGWGGTQRLPRLVGCANALEMFFTASAVDAEHALRIGLVDDIAGDPVAASLAKIGELISSY